MTLTRFLAKKPLYYREIDYTRMPRTFQRIAQHFTIPKIVHVVGTNGKGTTGRFLANMLHHAGHRVGHYSSPHIVTFHERIWIDGENSDDDRLEAAHQQLLLWLNLEDADALSYFEYTTLLAMLCFQECEYVVLEAGLGGEHDATNVFPKVLSLFTPIGYDHQDFLGEDLQSIATTKCQSMTHRAIIGKQRYDEVEFTCRLIAKERDCRLYTIEELLSASEQNALIKVSSAATLPRYLQENLALAFAATKVLEVPCEITTLDMRRPFGRFYSYAQNITIDVGHNPLAAEALKKAFEGNRVILVYNSYADKDYEAVLRILKPIIAHVEILAVDDERMVAHASLEATLRKLHIAYKDFRAVDAKKTYLVFGSFKVVEAFVRGAYA